jgi:NADH-quinone oxidoreductase subunit J
MTTRPRLAVDLSYRKGIGAVLLFGVLAWTFVQAPLPVPQGYGEGSIIRSIGFALFDMLELIPAGHGETESFLVAFLIIAVVLDAALDGAVMLARREEGGSIVTALADGGLPVGTAEDSSESEPTDRPTTEQSADPSVAEAGDDGSSGGLD